MTQQNFIFGISLFISLCATANSQEDIKPVSICKSIDSMKYQSQCESIIYNGRFDLKGLKVCLVQKNDYDKKSCLEVIKNKTYTSAEIAECTKDPKQRVHMCLKKSGKQYDIALPTEPLVEGAVIQDEIAH